MANTKINISYQMTKDCVGINTGKIDMECVVKNVNLPWDCDTLSRHCFTSNPYHATVVQKSQ